ncbi:hypothetical protein T310_6307, partial [Rasamsonia emersonii CBS 393.64]
TRSWICSWSIDAYSILPHRQKLRLILGEKKYNTTSWIRRLILCPRNQLKQKRDFLWISLACFSSDSADIICFLKITNRCYFSFVSSVRNHSFFYSPQPTM